MKRCLCSKCEKNEAEFRVNLNPLETIDVCEDCLEKYYDDKDYIPLDELEMDEEEKEDWDTFVEYYNK